MSIKIASMNFGDCDTILHNTPNGMKNIAEVLGPNGELYWTSTKELTGIPPLSIRSNGTMLLDYLISGNMSQSGTPSPTTPIQPQETGERTGNLWDEDYTGISATAIYKPIYVGNENVTLSTDCPLYQSTGVLFILAGNVSSGISTDTNGVWLDHPKTVTPINGYVTIAFRGYQTTSPVGYHAMLNLGSLPLPYEKFGYKIPISSGGVNLFDRDNVVFSGFYPNADTGAVVNTASGKLLSIIVPCEPNTSYTWSFDRIVANLRNRVAGYAEYPIVGMSCEFLDTETDPQPGSTRAVQKFTTTADTHWLILMVTETGQTAETLTEDVAENAQLEIGTEMTPYEPYVQPTLSNIYLGEVESTRRIRKLVLTGEETVDFFSYSPDLKIVTVKIPVLNKNVDEDAYCTSYSYNPQKTLVYRHINNNEFCTIKSSEKMLDIWIRDEEHATSSNDFKSFLARQYANGTPVTVWYVLATEETAVVNEPIRKIGDYADTLSMEQAGVSVPTLHGNTVIDVETTLKPSQMYIKYK